jgi:hypothetical protein
VERERRGLRIGLDRQRDDLRDPLAIALAELELQGSNRIPRRRASWVSSSPVARTLIVPMPASWSSPVASARSR